MKPCETVHRAVKAGRGLSSGEEQHLFGCPRCRRQSRSERVDREIDALAGLASPDPVVPPDFVARVVRGLPSEIPKRPVFEAWKWAAALAVFSVAAGYGFTVWTDTIAAGQQVAATSSTSPSEETAFLNF
jgi:predicted anti-sigma-YlaC factor YlaD